MLRQPKYNDITILLDRSGSMTKIARAMEGALEEFFTEHKRIPSTKVSLYQFDTQGVECVFENRLVGEVPKVVISPRGGTPLIDAACETIDKVGEKFSAMRDYKDRPAKVLFIMITDGEENASRNFKKADLKRRVETQHGTYKWEFVYLGANQDAIAEAASFGIAAGSTVTYGYNNIDTTTAMKHTASNTSAFFAAEDAVLPTYTNLQRTQSNTGGFLEKKKKNGSTSKSN